MGRVRRYYELTMHALNDRLSEDQISELVGLDLYNDFLTDQLTQVGIPSHKSLIISFQPGREDRDEWLYADLFSSKLSRDEWKSVSKATPRRFFVVEAIFDWFSVVFWMIRAVEGFVE